MSEEPWKGQKVLIVEDSQKQQEEIANIFSSLGLEIQGKVSNGLEALESIKQEKPDLVSLDIIMPVMHGIECLEKIRLMDKDLKVVFVTCLSELHPLKEEYKDRIEEHLLIGKPLDLTDLLKSLSKLYDVAYIAPSNSEVEDQEGIDEASAEKEKQEHEGATEG